MKKTIALALATTTALSTAAFAQDITEFRIGILGGENAQDRMNSYSCLQDYAAEELGVEVKLFAPADYNLSLIHI